MSQPNKTYLEARAELQRNEPVHSSPRRRPGSKPVRLAPAVMAPRQSREPVLVGQVVAQLVENLHAEADRRQQANVRKGLCA